jgi:hypothetical protein
MKKILTILIAIAAIGAGCNNTIYVDPDGKEYIRHEVCVRSHRAILGRTIQVICDSSIIVKEYRK